MHRRKFIRDIAIYSAGITTIPFFMQSCKKKDDTESSPKHFSGRVIIIGAGAAGLYAGKTLKENNVDFLILEADSRIGGRIKKNETFADFTIDLGAQWLHGEKTFLKKLADSSGTNTYIDGADWIHKWYNGQFVNSFPQQYSDFKAVIESDYTLLPDVSFRTYGIQQGYSPGVLKLLELPASTSGTCASRVSVKGYAKEVDKWDFGEEGYWFAESLYDFYDKEVISKVKDKIVTNSQVTKVDYSSDKIKVSTKNGKTYEADKVIVTVAIPILKDGDITFEPALPKEKTDAFSKIGMDHGSKVFLKFDTRFYNGSILSNINGSKFIDAPYGKNSNDNILLTSYFGERAEYFDTKTETQIVTELLAELDIMFNGAATSSFKDVIIQNWGKEPFIRGAYSYQPVGVGNARETAAKPINNKLFFAGEAMHTGGAYQIIDGAAETGYIAANTIIKSA